MDHIIQIYNHEIVHVYPGILKNHLSQYKDATFLSMKLTKPRKPKTNKQLGYYYAVILPIILDGMLELGWTYSVTVQGVVMEFKMTLEKADLWLKYTLAKGKNKTDMSCEEATAFIEECLHCGSVNFDRNIPPPPEKE